MDFVPCPNDNISAVDLYNPLPFTPTSKCIRVLEVQKADSSEKDDGQIISNLRTVELHALASPFTALTYTWGEKASKPHTITCGGHSIEVTKNCYFALQYLRKKLGSFSIWIDAICINQGDNTEKMQQITLMGEIYSFAETVYVWLGRGNKSTQRAMKFLQTCGFQRYFDHFDRLDTEQDPKSRPWAATLACLRDGLNLKKHPFPLNTSEPGWLSRKVSRDTPYASFSDLNVLLDVDWIRRMWTYQEIIFASNPIVVCGDDFLKWDQLALGVVFLEFSGAHHQRILTRNNCPRFPVLESWAKVALCRDQLCQSSSKTSVNASSDATEAGQPSRLLKYQKFSLRFSENVVKLRQVFRIMLSFVLSFGLFSFVTGGFSIGIGLGNTASAWDPPSSSQIEMISNMSTLLAACAKGCLANMTAQACNHACKAARDVGMPNLSFTSMQPRPIRTPLWVHVGVWSVLALFVLICSTLLKLLDVVFGFMIPVLHPQGSKVDLASAICSRDAREQRDKAFALQAILQKLMGKELPVPDSSRSLEDIYTELTVRILEATNSLELLISAAQHNFPGKPSWTPNWAAKFENLWLQPPMPYGQPPNATPGSKSYWRRPATNDAVLIVRGRWLCSVTKHFQFQETQHEFEADQRDLHLENLRTMIDLCNIVQGNSMQYLSHFSIKKQTSEFGLFAPLTHRADMLWAIFFIVMCKGDPKEILLRFEKQASSKLLFFFFKEGYLRRFWHLVWKNTRLLWPALAINIIWLSVICSVGDVQRIVIDICNVLAESRKALFAAHMYAHASRSNVGRGDRRWDEYLRAEEQSKKTIKDPEPTKRTLGICNYGVEKGDGVVLIAGVRTPLLIRRGDYSTKLVSPAFVNGTASGQAWNQTWEEEDLNEYYLS